MPSAGPGRIPLWAYSHYYMCRRMTAGVSDYGGVVFVDAACSQSNCLLCMCGGGGGSISAKHNTPSRAQSSGCKSCCVFLPGFSSFCLIHTSAPLNPDLLLDVYLYFIVGLQRASEFLVGLVSHLYLDQMCQPRC